MPLQFPRQVMFSLCLLLLFVIPHVVSAEVRTIIFPVNGAASFFDDFRNPRGGGTREHLGNDIIAPKMTPVVAAVDGVVSYVVSPEASWGYSVAIQDNDGYQYRYLHLNNDTPGTDDGKGGEQYAYMAGVRRGVVVRAGEQIGWVGDSGLSEETVPHLHFEIRGPDRIPLNPFDSLTAAAARSPIASQIKLSGALTAVHASPGERGVTEGAQFVFVAELREGLQGEAVRQLQSRLKAEGYFKNFLTNYFGPVTRAALEEYQKVHHIPPTGVLSFETRAALNGVPGTTPAAARLEKNLLEGAEGEQVRQLQLKLFALGYFTATSTGTYDSVTREAVRHFQVVQALSPSGAVYQDTWTRLHEAYAAATSTTTPPILKPPLKAAASYTMYLEEGASGPEVTLLQKELHMLGFFSTSSPITGYFGPLTREALIKFQAANGINAIGVVGPHTRAVLNAL